MFPFLNFSPMMRFLYILLFFLDTAVDLHFLIEFFD